MSERVKSKPMRYEEMDAMPPRIVPKQAASDARSARATESSASLCTSRHGSQTWTAGEGEARTALGTDEKAQDNDAHLATV